jgi:Histidine kinase
LSKKDAAITETSQICIMNMSTSGVRKLVKSPFWRIFLHIGFWLFYLSLPFYAYLQEYPSTYAYVILILVNLAYLPFYYFLAYFIIPKYFNKKKWWLFILFSIGTYALFSLACKGIELAFFDRLTSEKEITDFKEAIDKPILDIWELLRMIFVTIIPLSIMMMRRMMRIYVERTELIKMNTELELNLLKSQINPHFLFNTLNNIYSLSLQKSDRSPEMILKLSDLMRYMLYECNVPFIDLQREIQFLQDYIDLEKIRHGEKVEILFSVQGAPDGLKIPPLLLIPFVENAFKHGVNAQFGNAWVHISLLLENNHIVFEIKNNKPQTAAQRNLNSSGIGIENAKKRLQLIYPNKHVLEINDLSASFHIKLSIDK